MRNRRAKNGPLIPTLSANPQATGYKIVRGIQAQLPDLLTANDDSCLRWTGAATTFTATEVPAAGSFYWYLVIGTNATGDGHACFASGSVPRICTTAEGCPREILVGRYGEKLLPSRFVRRAGKDDPEPLTPYCTKSWRSPAGEVKDQVVEAALATTG